MVFKPCPSDTAMAQGSGENTLSLQILADPSILDAGVALVAGSICRMAGGAGAPRNDGAGNRPDDRRVGRLALPASSRACLCTRRVMQRRVAKLRRKGSTLRSPRPLVSGGGIDGNRALLARCASIGVPRGTPHAKIVTHMGRDIRGGSVDATASIEPCPSGSRTFAFSRPPKAALDHPLVV